MNDALRAALVEKARREKARRQGTAQQNAPIATTADGGRVFRAADGSLSFASPGFSTTDQDTIARIMEGATPAQASEWTPEVSTGGAGVIAARGALQGVSHGYSDEVTARAASLLSGRDYETELAAERQRLTQGREEAPVAAIGGEVAGAVAAPAAAIRALRGPSYLGRAAASGGVAAASGALYGFGAGEGGITNRAQNAAVTGAISGGIGALAPFGGTLAKQLFDRVARLRAPGRTARNAPSTDALRSQARQLFERADSAPALDRATLTSAATGIAQRAERAGLDEALTPQADRAVTRVLDEATNQNPQIAFRDLDVLRRQASVPAGNRSNPVEAAIGSRLVEDLDGVVDAASPQLGRDVAKARELWGRLRRTELLDNAAETAQNQASGFENGLRVEYRKILNNPRKRRGFSKDEIAAMERVVRGSTLNNVARTVGKLGVGVGQQSNALLAVTGTAGGVALGGLGGLAVPVAGTVAQKLAERGTRKSAELARGLAASGGAQSVPQLGNLQRLLIESLARRGANTVEAVR
ncbi:hypothetical protein KMP13_02355 [Epibacterium ulvae]|uniref:hypothetical protein n=1 Tax=Epibacterium ulvae TaxID=1156985 RepID=UPI001BFCCF18|nr:hypothetical protein [Epibacterium ulvae]MBT8152756.1 hypothetical protein [Epibacterium ulvae]